MTSNQNTEFKILVLSNNQYDLGILKGYCYARGCCVEEVTDKNGISKKIVDLQPSLIFLDTDFALETADQETWSSLMEIINYNKIPVCALSKTDMGEVIKQDWAITFEHYFIEPLDIEQLDSFLRVQIVNHEKPLWERRVKDRRSNDERRVLRSRRVVDSPVYNIEKSDRRQINN